VSDQIAQSALNAALAIVTETVVAIAIVAIHAVITASHTAAGEQ
jgi:hypothetical protein